MNLNEKMAQLCGQWFWSKHACPPTDSPELDMSLRPVFGRLRLGHSSSSGTADAPPGAFNGTRARTAAGQRTGRTEAVHPTLLALELAEATFGAASGSQARRAARARRANRVDGRDLGMTENWCGAESLEGWRETQEMESRLQFLASIC